MIRTPVSFVGNEWTAASSIKEWNYVVLVGEAYQSTSSTENAAQRYKLILCLDCEWGGKPSESVRLTGSSRVWLAHFYPGTPYQLDTITYASTNLELRWISAAGSVCIQIWTKPNGVYRRDRHEVVISRGFGVPSCRFRVIHSWYPYWAGDVEQALHYVV